MRKAKGKWSPLLTAAGIAMNHPRQVRCLAAACAALLGLGLWSVPAAYAQSDAPKFEVSTVKPRKSGTPMHIFECSGDRFMSAGPALGDLLLFAFDAPHDFMASVPAGLRSEYYDIDVKASGPIQSLSQCRLVVQAFLADRFKLAVHWEEQETEVFDLVVARGGPKLQKALPADEGTDVSIIVDGRMAGGIVWGFATDPEMRGLKGLTMQQLAQNLYVPGPPIMDKTGLEGRYKIDLRYSNGLSANAGDAPVDPPLDAALAKLGLRLEKKKGSVKIPVLDHIEAPNEN
jgi:uncharacterized protein (TIGR03435 family)